MLTVARAWASRLVEAGPADASLVVLADRFATRRLLTLDRRRFSVVRALDGAPFELPP